MAKGGYNKKGNGILAFILCLPLAFIIYFLISYSSQTITLNNVKKVTVTSPDSEAIVLEAQEDIDLFVEALTSGTPVSSAVRNIDGEKPVIIVCQREDKSIEYKLYPSLNLSGCMLFAPEGEIYVLKTETARSLLLRSEFDYLYKEYFLPQLSVVSGETVYNVAPTQCEWNYVKSDDKTYKYTPESLASGSEVYAILKGLENNLRFGDGTKAPDEYDISFVSENGTKYESISDISELNLSVDTRVTVEITAEWSNRNGAKYFGTAKYKFNVMYDVPAKIEINKTEFVMGDVIEVYASHLNADEKITLDTLLNVNGFKFGMLERDLGVALIPVGLGNSSGEASLLIGTDVSSVNTDIVINELTVSGDPVSVAVGNTQYEKMFALSVMEDFDKAVADIAKPENRPERNDYFNYNNANFTAPVSGEVKYSFGQEITIGFVGNYSDSGKRTLNGIVYSATEGAAVRSMEAGEVVYMGELVSTGKSVVIYHGYGIYSYYYHLSEFDYELQVGAQVNAGATIGHVGSVKLSDDKSSSVLHFATSINGVFVNPMWFLSK